MESPGLYEDWTGNVVNDADLRSLDIGAVRAARAMFCERFPSLADESRGWDDRTFLSRAGVLKRGKVTVAALILLGKRDAGVLPDTVCIRWRLIGRDGSVEDSRTFQGPMLLASTQAVSMVRNWTVPSGPEGRQASAYRVSVLQEAVRNALQHQDYALGGTIDVIERDSESVEVVSRGSFPRRTPESFIDGPPQAKVPRNQFLVSAMAGLGAVPASGSGIKSMYLAQASRRFPMPDFDVSDDRVSVLFHGIRAGAYARVLDLREDIDLRTMIDLDRLAKLRFVPERRIRSLVRRGLVEVMDGVPCIASGAGQDVLSAFVTGTEEDAVLDLIDRNGSVTRADVADILAARDRKELSPEQVRVKATNLLQSMRRRGLVEKADGSTRSARYVRGPDSTEDTGSDRRCLNNRPRNRCVMYPAAVRGRVVIVAMMLLCACAVIAVPAFSAGASAAGSESASAVSVESDTVVIVAELDEESTVEDVASEYAKIQSEKRMLESEDKKVFVSDPGAPKEGDAGRVADMFRHAMGPECFMGPEPRGGPMPPSDPRPDAFPEPPDQQSAPAEEQDVPVIASSDIDAQPDIQVVQEVVGMIQDSGDEGLRSISDTLQAYLAWLVLWGGDDTTAAVVSVDRKDDPEDDEQQDGEPYIVDAEDEEDDPGEDPEPAYEPAGSPDVPETSSFYYTGVTTSGLSS